MFQKQCDHSETRLACIDCNKPICPKCMVMCAVGSRCKACTKGFESHVTKMTPWSIALVLSLSFIASFPIFITFLLVTLIPYVGCTLNLLAAGACGYFAGKLIHKASGYKYGKKLLPFVLIPLILGFVINPLCSPLPAIMSIFSSPYGIEATFHSLLLPTIAAATISIPLLHVR